MFACDACGDVFSNAIHARTHDLRRCTASSTTVVTNLGSLSSENVVPNLMEDEDVDFGIKLDMIDNSFHNNGPSGSCTYA